MTRILCITAALSVSSGVAFADDPPPASSAKLTLPARTTEISGSTLIVNVGTDIVGDLAIAKPVSLAPSIWRGINDHVTFGLTHDGGSTRWTPRPGLRSLTTVVGGLTVTAVGGAGVCLAGKNNGCPQIYDNVSWDTLFGVAEGKLELALHPALDIFSFDPDVLFRFRAGVLGRVEATSKVAIVFDPRLGLGLSNREKGNKEAIDIPVWVWLTTSDRVGVYVASGVAGPLDGFGDAFTIPVGLGASFTASAKVTLGGDFFFSNLAGKSGGVDGRLVGFRAAFTL